MSYELEILEKIKLLRDEVERLSTQGGTGIWKAWTPTFGGFSTDPTNLAARYMIDGKTCYVVFRAGTVGISDANNFTISAPVAAVTVTNGTWRAACALITDDGTTSRGVGYVGLESGESVISVSNAAGPTSWTTSGNKSAHFEFFYEVA